MKLRYWHPECDSDVCISCVVITTGNVHEVIHAVWFLYGRIEYIKRKTQHIILQNPVGFQIQETQISNSHRACTVAIRTRSRQIFCFHFPHWSVLDRVLLWEESVRIAINRHTMLGAYLRNISYGCMLRQDHCTCILCWSVDRAHSHTFVEGIHWKHDGRFKFFIVLLRRWYSEQISSVLSIHIFMPKQSKKTPIWTCPNQTVVDTIHAIMIYNNYVMGCTS